VDIGRHRALATEQATWLDMQRGRGDVAPDLAGRRDLELLDGDDLALDGARDMDVLRLEGRDHAACLADDQIAQALDVPLDGAVDSGVAIGLERADDAGVRADHRFRLAVKRRRRRRLRLLASAEHWASSAAPAEGIRSVLCAGRPSDPHK